MLLMPMSLSPSLNADADADADAVDEVSRVPRDENLLATDKPCMDGRLRHHLASLTVSGTDLPLELGNFYERYVVHHPSNEGEFELDVHKSSYRCASKWLREMEREGLVVLKKHWNTGRAYRKKTSAKSVVAVGTEQVKLFHGHRLASLEQVSTNEEKGGTNRDSEDEASDDDTVSDAILDISIKKTRHAKQRQKTRDISDDDIRKTIAARNAPLQRKRNGVKTISAGGITAVVSGGGKNQILTTWKEPTNGTGSYLSRWTDPTASGDVIVVDSFLQQKTVTVVETYLRYEKTEHLIGTHGRKIKKSWVAGDRVRKNQKYRKKLLVVGLHPELIKSTVKQIQSQMGIHVSVSNLQQEEWEKLIGEESSISPKAEEGSKTISFNVPEESRIISRALRYIEAVVPPKYRRYLKEELLEQGDEGTGGADSSGVQKWHIKNKTAEARKVFDARKVEELLSIREEMINLYSKYAPDKVDEIPDMLEKYRGRETALLEAAKRKYAETDDRSRCAGGTCTQAIDETKRKTCTHVNVDDLLGAADEDEQGKYAGEKEIKDDGVFERVNASLQHSYEEEDLSTFF